MRIAYGLLGIMMLLVFGGAYFFFERSTIPMTMKLSSPAFENNGLIPSRFTCDGENVIPPLSISGAPEGTQSFVLVMEDPDIPQAIKESMKIDVFDHLVVYNIVPTTTEISERNKIVGTSGRTTRGVGYTGPCPPREYEPREHRYVFTLYALDKILFTNIQFKNAPDKQLILSAAEGHILGKAILIGRYERPVPAL